ncbi:MAG: helix-turn-helix domain-containing protein [Opitutales bacterium]|nr:helix-turn-helix domain-containing protein [Opitutales bacterium]
MESNVIVRLRKAENLSQEELAKRLGISRQTLLKYENGEKPSTRNLKKIADFFDVAYDNILDNKMPVVPSYNIVPAEKNEAKPDLRINIPQENIEKFKQVFLYILTKVGAKPNVGQTVLYKLLYFIDFDYYELYEEQLMGLKYIKNTYGPTPVDFAKITRQMAESGEIEIVKSKYFSREQTKYLPIKNPDLSLLSAQEFAHLNKELDRLSDMSAKEISDFSHKDIPWVGTEDKGIIEYEAVFYRNRDTSVRSYD